MLSLIISIPGPSQDFETVKPKFGENFPTTLSHFSDLSTHILYMHLERKDSFAKTPPSTHELAIFLTESSIFVRGKGLTRGFRGGFWPIYPQKVKKNQKNPFFENFHVFQKFFDIKS
jgi:hypothetical protein